MFCDGNFSYGIEPVGSGEVSQDFHGKHAHICFHGFGPNKHRDIVKWIFWKQSDSRLFKLIKTCFKCLQCQFLTLSPSQFISLKNSFLWRVEVEAFLLEVELSYIDCMNGSISLLLVFKPPLCFWEGSSSIHPQLECGVLSSPVINIMTGPGDWLIMHQSTFLPMIGFNSATLFFYRKDSFYVR